MFVLTVLDLTIGIVVFLALGYIVGVLGGSKD